MSREEYESTLLSTMEFYQDDASYVPWFKKYNVSLVKDLFDVRKMGPIVKTSSSETVAEIKVLLHAIKFKYFNEPILGNNEILNKRLGIISPEKYNLLVNPKYQISLDTMHFSADKKYFNLRLFLGASKPEYESMIYLLEHDEKLIEAVKTTNFKVIDLLRWISNNYYYVSFIDIVNLFIESYEKTLGGLEDIGKSK